MGAKGLIARGVPPQPSWLWFIRGPLLIVTVALLGLTGWGLSLFDYSNIPSGYTYTRYDGPFIYMMFMVIFTLICYGVCGGIELWAPNVFFRIGAFIAYIINALLLLGAWAWCADYATYSAIFTDLGIAAFGSVAGVGAIVWVLMVVYIVFFALACVKDPAETTQSLPMHQQQPQPSFVPAPGQQQAPQQPMGQPMMGQQPPMMSPQHTGQQQMMGQPQMMGHQPMMGHQQMPPAQELGGQPQYMPQQGYPQQYPSPMQTPSPHPAAGSPAPQQPYPVAQPPAQ